jgi:hypothetical protein
VIASLLILNFVWAALFGAHEWRERRRDDRDAEFKRGLLEALDRFTRGSEVQAQATQTMVAALKTAGVF